MKTVQGGVLIDMENADTYGKKKIHVYSTYAVVKVNGYKINGQATLSSWAAHEATAAFNSF